MFSSICFIYQVAQQLTNPATPRTLLGCFNLHILLGCRFFQCLLWHKLSYLIYILMTYCFDFAHVSGPPTWECFAKSNRRYYLRIFYLIGGPVNPQPKRVIVTDANCTLLDAKLVGLVKLLRVSWHNPPCRP